MGQPEGPGRKKGGKTGGKGRKKDSSGQSLPQANRRDESKRLDSLVGAVTGDSRTTVAKRAAVIESGSEKLIADMNRTGKVNGVLKRLKTLEAAEAIAQESPPLPTGLRRFL